MLWSLGFYELFGQHVEAHDLALVGLLIVLEGVLSVDNALVLGLLAKRLPKHQQGKALTYGLVGAFVFRFIAIALATYLMRWWFVKLLGGGYLVYVSIKHFLFEHDEEPEERVAVREGQPVLLDAGGQPLARERQEQEIEERSPLPATLGQPKPVWRQAAKFWPTVAVIELTDIAFAIDSILAAIALVGSPPPGHDLEALHPKMWVVFTGGMLGVVLMRFAAVVFIKLLDRFPRFEMSAYLLVLVIGFKLLGDWYFNARPEGAGSEWHPPLDFHSPHSWAFWVFWGLMIACFLLGFLPQKKHTPAGQAGGPPA
jgi:YkoY family integral membrane protein